MQCVSCVVWLLLKAQTTSFTIKNFCFRREAERRINSPTVEVNPMMRSIDVLQFLISTIARFCDINIYGLSWGSNPRQSATWRGQPFNEHGYLGRPPERCDFHLLIKDSSFISYNVACTDESNLHYDWKAAKMMLNSAYISLGNISDVMEKTFSWFDVHWTTMQWAWLSWLAARTVWLGVSHPGLDLLNHMLYGQVNVICIITDRLRLRWIIL